MSGMGLIARNLLKINCDRREIEKQQEEQDLVRNLTLGDDDSDDE